MLVLLFPFTAIAQVEEIMDDWIPEDATEDEVAEMNDMLQEYISNKVNINDTIAMASLPFLSPFQLKALSNYIILHGQLLSFKELAFVPGFDSATRALLEIMTTVEPYAVDSKWQWWQGRHSVITGIGGTVEQATGYSDSIYAGDNLRALFCYTYSYLNRVNVRFVADKDPTEAWGKGNFYGYHLMLNDIGKVEKLIIGRYNLQFGQGLTL